MKHIETLSVLENSEHGTKEENLLYLMPLVEMAWAHGAISPRERRLVFNFAREDSIDERDDLNDTLAGLLVYQPPQDFYASCKDLIREKFSRSTVRERRARREQILERCRSVAAAAGGKTLMDIDHHVSDEERNLLVSLDRELNWPE